MKELFGKGLFISVITVVAGVAALLTALFWIAAILIAAGNLAIWPVLVLYSAGLLDSLPHSPLTPLVLGFIMLGVVYLGFQYAEAWTEGFFQFLVLCGIFAMVAFTVVSVTGGLALIILREMGFDLPFWTVIPMSIGILYVWSQFQGHASPKKSALDGDDVGNE